jgi:haloacetate dehalogenase
MVLRRAGAVQAVCDDYRASASIDGGLDAQDQQGGHRLVMPVLAAWQDPGDAQLPFDPQQIWASWAPQLDSRVLPAGHFLPEETPEEVSDAIDTLMRT